MRVTQRAVALTSLQGLNRNLDAVGRLQQQLTSGKLINQPSDSPIGTNKAMQTRQNMAAATQQARNISDGKGMLDAADTALQNMLDQARRVRDLTVQASNAGGMSASSRQAIATEIAGLRASMLGVANQKVQGRPIFGGVTTGTVAYDAAGSYVGVGGTASVPVQPVNRRISNSEALRVDITGPEAFGDPAAGDLFAVVGQIATDVVSNPTALAGHLDALDASINTMLTAAADVGTRAARLDQADRINQDLQLSLQAQLSDVEDIDLPKTIMQLQMQQTGYQAALSATAKAIQPTLLDFLR